MFHELCAGLGASRIAADVLWSDPVMEPGISLNDSRGVGIKASAPLPQFAPGTSGIRDNASTRSRVAAENEQCMCQLTAWPDASWSQSLLQSNVR